MEYYPIEVASFKEVEAFRQAHNEIHYEFVDNYILLTSSKGDKIKASVPYTNGFCMHPIKCAGYNSCPRDRACSE